MSTHPYPYAASLTVDIVKDYVKAIATMAGDDEMAHAAEDSLRKEVLTAIAIGQLRDTDAAIAALACLETERIKFARWCA